ncbi:hypothetical protein RDV84_11625 [Lysobacter yananisis]|uniref:DUF892 family protein n=1 Tax=Lysobacter yananisis TaxID=1003114 RepID=A0ABY9PEY3_9GAMM|nr:hypothetical protein [Lysobacter yananisis]WMT05461.1 hypothetical protein RDV84_11625 [Lysobacter yananisis]
MGWAPSRSQSAPAALPRAFPADELFLIRACAVLRRSARTSRRRRRGRDGRHGLAVAGAIPRRRGACRENCYSAAMNDANAFPSQWRAMREADAALLACRFHLKKHADFAHILAQALACASERNLALRFLRDDAGALSDAQLAELAPAIVDLAVDGNLDDLIVARQTLVRYAARFTSSRGVVEDAVARVMDGYLAREDDFVLRRLAELLLDAGFAHALRRLLAACKDHMDPDIAEIHDDFSRHLA